MAFNKLKNFRNSGFGSNINNEGERLITKKGQFNIKKEGLSFSQRFDLFHTLINMNTTPFFIFLFIGFVFINLLFTLTYLAIGLDGIAGATSNHNFFDAFFFSAQTLTTVGYGGLHPTGRLIGLIAGFEAFIGLLSFAIATGLLYGRFSKPKQNMLFSQNILISPYGDITGLMARVANPKNTQLIDVEAKMIYSQIELENNVKKRNFYTLDLEMNKISLFSASWTVVHPITNESPLYQLTTKDIEERNVELILLLNGYDETYNQHVHFRTSYKPEEFIENAKFIPILSQNENKQSIIRLDKINLFEKF
ncbi:MAG: ion channel [Flavobacteriales bacterium]